MGTKKYQLGFLMKSRIRFIRHAAITDGRRQYEMFFEILVMQGNEDAEKASELVAHLDEDVFTFLFKIYTADMVISDAEQSFLSIASDS